MFLEGIPQITTEALRHSQLLKPAFPNFCVAYRSGSTSHYSVWVNDAWYNHVG